MTDSLRAMLKEEGYLELTEIPGRGICGLKQFMFTWAIVYGIDEHDYLGRWCFNTFPHALSSYLLWDGEGDPLGYWIKYKGYGGERSNKTTP